MGKLLKFFFKVFLSLKYKFVIFKMKQSFGIFFICSPPTRREGGGWGADCSPAQHFIFSFSFFFHSHFWRLAWVSSLVCSQIFYFNFFYLLSLLYLFTLLSADFFYLTLILSIISSYNDKKTKINCIRSRDFHLDFVNLVQE